MFGKFLLTDIILANNSANPREFGQSPPDVRRNSLEIVFGGRLVDPCKNRAESAWIRSGMSSAEGKAIYTATQKIILKYKGNLKP